MAKRINLPVFPACGPDRVWRIEVNQRPKWSSSASDRALGARVNLADGIYIVTVSEKTPAEWIHLAYKVSDIASGQHPESSFLPGDNYDSAIAVHESRTAGAVLARTEWRCPYHWVVSLKPDGTPYDLGEFPSGALIPRTTGDQFVPTIMTLWVHPAHRRKGIGRQLVAAIAQHFGLAIDQIGFRLPLWKESVHMVEAMGLSKIVSGT